MLSLSQHNLEAYKPAEVAPNPWFLRDGPRKMSHKDHGVPSSHRRTSPPSLSPRQMSDKMTGSTDQMTWLSSVDATQGRPETCTHQGLEPNSDSLFRPPLAGEYQFPFYGSHQRAYAGGFYHPAAQYGHFPPPRMTTQQHFFPPSLDPPPQRPPYPQETSPPADKRMGKEGLRPHYKALSGKEGSLKHRLLRPPDIHILEPPASVVADAPLSAPPLQSSKQPRVPTYFAKGSVIQLANGNLKRVEDLLTDDFLQSAELSPDLRIDSSTVLSIEPSSRSARLGFSVGHNKVQVTVEAAVEHPFFVFNRGWSSCCPERSLRRYGLTCHKLSVGDVCISLTHKDAARCKKPAGQRKRRSSAPS